MMAIKALFKLIFLLLFLIVGIKILNIFLSDYVYRAYYCKEKGSNNCITVIKDSNSRDTFLLPRKVSSLFILNPKKDFIKVYARGDNFERDCFKSCVQGLVIWENERKFFVFDTSYYKGDFNLQEADSLIHLTSNGDKEFKQPDGNIFNFDRNECKASIHFDQIRYFPFIVPLFEYTYCD